MKLEVGQKIYLKAINNNKKQTITVEITKINRKYFYVKEIGGNRLWIERDKFYIDTLKAHEGSWESQWQGYLSEQDIEDKKEQEELSYKFSKMFDYRRSSLSLEKLRKMYEIACG